MKRIITLAIPLLFVSYAFSQPWLKNLPQTKSKSELSLYDYRKAFNEYWKPYNIDNGYYIKDGVKTKAFGWKQFKRWEWNWESQVDLKTGKFPTKEQFDALKTNRNPVTKSGNKGADWQSEGPNYVTDPGFWGIGRINCITFHPTDNNIYWVGAASGGLWVTTDNGNNWTCHTDDNAVLAVSDIAIPSDYSSSNTIYIATGDRDSWDYRSVGVLKSTDGGITWNTTDLSFSFADEDMVSRLLIDPKDDQTIIASTYKGGVLKTTDGGTNWSTQLSTRYFIDMEHKPGDFNTLYGSTKTGGEIHVSNDGGKTWNTSINTEGDRIEIAVSSDEPTWVYAIVSGNNGGLFGIYKSEDSGNNFNQILDGTASGNNLLGRSINGTSSGGQGSYDLSIAVSPNDANTIIIGGIMSHISYNGGVSWSCSSYYRPLTNNSGEYPIVHADKHMHKYRKDGALFETNDGGIYVSTDNGKSWSHKTNTMVISEMYRLGVSASNEGEVITGLQDNSSKLLHNRGIWKNVLGGDGMECIIDYTNSKVQFASIQKGYIARTKDHWQTYSCISENIDDGTLRGAWITPYVIDYENPNVLYAGYDDVWKTTDQGDSWTRISYMSTYGKLRSLAIAPSDNKVLYIANADNMWVTRSGGGSWTNITLGLPANTITYIAIKNDDPATAWVTLGGYDSNSVYQTTDYGSTWTNISSGLPQLPVKTIVQNKLETDETSLYCGTEIGVYSKSGSSDWIPFNDNLPNVKIGELEIYYNETTPDDSKLYAATYGRGLWSTPLVNEVKANITATSGCGAGTGTVKVNSNKSGILTFYLFNSDGSVEIANSGTTDVISHNFTNVSDGTYTSKVENDGIISVLSSSVTLTNNVVVPNQPGIISGDNTPCQSSNQAYTITEEPDVSYNWSLPSDWTGTSTSNTINTTIGLENGTIEVTPSNSCGAGTVRTFSVTVSPLPEAAENISGNIEYCQSYPATEYSTNTINYADSYIWTLPEGVTINGNSALNTISVNYNNDSKSGNFTVKGHNECGNGTESSLSVTVKDAVSPVIKTKWDDILICLNLGDTIVSYQWYKNGNAVTNATEQFYVSGKEAGTYYVIATDIYDCTVKSNEISLSAKNGLNVYPNPASNEFKLNIDDTSKGNISIIIYNNAGKMVKHIKRQKNSEIQSFLIPVSDLQNGIYHIYTKINNNQKYYSKLIVN